MERIKPKFQIGDKVFVNPFAKAIPLSKEGLKQGYYHPWVMSPEHYMDILNGEAKVVNRRICKDPLAAFAYYEYKLEWKENPENKAAWCVPESFLILKNGAKYRALYKYFKLIAEQEEAHKTLEKIQIRLKEYKKGLSDGEE